MMSEDQEAMWKRAMRQVLDEEREAESAVYDPPPQSYTRMTAKLLFWIIIGLFIFAWGFVWVVPILLAVLAR